MDRAEAYKSIVAGVTTLDFTGPSAPCELLLSGDMAFPVVVNESGQVLVAASGYGKGRVLVFGNDEFLNSPNSFQLLRNAVSWLGSSKNPAVDIDSSLTNLHKALTEAGIPATLSESFSKEFGVYCMNIYEDQQVDDLITFLKNGGGLLIGGHAKQLASSNDAKKVLSNFPGNNIISVAGIHFTSMEAKQGVFTITDKIPEARLEIPHVIDVTEDLKHLLNGMSHLDINNKYSPSNLLVHGQLAFPVGMSNDNECFIAAARYGMGRLVVVSHDKFLTLPHLQQFYHNVITWLDNGRNGKIGIDKAAMDFKDLINPSKFDSEISSLNDNYSVFCCTADSGQQEDKIHEFVAEGGGLLTAGKAWGWVSYNPGKSVIAGQPGNIMLNRFGISILPTTLKGDNFPVLNPEEKDKQYHFRRALLQFQQHIHNEDTLTSRMNSWLLRLRQDCSEVMKVPAKTCPMFDQFQHVLKGFVQKGGIPKVSKEHPVQSGSKEALLLDLVCAIGEAGPEHWDLIKTCIPPVIAKPSMDPISLEINATNKGGQAWISTGLYLLPGVTATVTFPSHVSEHGLSLQVQVGCHSDNLSNAEQFFRPPVVIQRYGVTEEQLQVSCIWGGLLYVLVPQNCKFGNITVTVEGAVRAPYFRRGVTSKSDWLEIVRSNQSPWAELATDNLILTVPTEDVVTLEDPDTLLALWDRIMVAIADLAAIPHTFPRPERFITDVQISAGSLHSGYPVMAELRYSNSVVDLELILSSGTWGIIHELGHNQQKSEWEFRPHTTEATCNLWSVYVHEEVLGIHRSKAHGDLNPEKRENRIKEYLKNGAKLKDYEMWTCLETYLQLQECFGWGPFKQLFADYQTMSDIKDDNTFKMNLWAEKFSLQVKKNLAPFFKSWGWPITDELSTKLSTLPEWEDNPMKKYIKQSSN